MYQEEVITKTGQSGSSHSISVNEGDYNPLVSIITASYNSQPYIAHTIRSVQQQTYTNWEMIIVDDCSTDNSLELIEEFLKDPRVKLLRHNKNKGIVAARNYAIERSGGNIIAILDSDDIWMPYKLERQIAIYRKTPGTAMVYSDYDYINDDGQSLNKIIRAPAKVGYYDILKSCSIGCLTSTYNVDVLGKIYFRQHGHEDYILWLDILKRGFEAINAGEILARYRITRNSISSNKVRAAKWQFKIYRNIEGLSLFKTLYYFSWYTFKGIRKHLY